VKIIMKTLLDSKKEIQNCFKAQSNRVLVSRKENRFKKLRETEGTALRTLTGESCKKEAGGSLSRLKEKRVAS